MFLSIVIPVYNVEDYIQRCLESILDLPIGNNSYEVIIVNDGTKDNSMSIVKDMLQDNYVIINQSNQGLGAARNTGLRAAKGEWVLFLDSDDYVDSTKLAELCRKASAPGIDIVIGDYTILYDQSKVVGKYTIDSENDICMNGREFFLRYYHQINTMVWRNLYRVDFLKAHSMQFTEGVCFEDVNWTPQCLLEAQKVYYSPIPFYYYVIRSGSIMQSKISEKKIDDYILVHKDLLVSSIRYDCEVQKKISQSTVLGLLVFNGQYSIYKNKELYRKLKETVSIKSSRYLRVSCIYWTWRVFPFIINPMLHMKYGKVNVNRF